PRRPVNRALALLLAADAIDWGALVGAQLTDSLDAAYAWVVVHFVADIGVLSAYLVFVGIALDTPLVRPFRSRLGRRVVLGLCGVAAAVVVVAPTTVLLGASYTGHEYYPIFGSAGPWLVLLWTSMTLCFTFGLVAAVDAWRRAASPIARRRARTYLVAFGIRDAVLIVSFGRAVYELFARTPASFDSFWSLFTIGGVGAYVAVLAYALLKEQLFDIDLKLKWTLRRGTLVGVFLAAFFVVAAVAEQYLQRYGALVGGVAVGLLFFALRPLERAADRFADAAMPAVRDTDEYRTVRKREVYRATVEAALQDGVVSERERDMLARLQDQLGLTATEAREIERDTAAVAVPPSS
ncbi:MAG TPA: hypothetical protein VI997_10660, partial [Candidatus Thermoplasmatota archaeon]|nr:hypothetical protein [Candidatus Thermoplasmatota archaeon]